MYIERKKWGPRIAPCLKKMVAGLVPLRPINASGKGGTSHFSYPSIKVAGLFSADLPAFVFPLWLNIQYANNDDCAMRDEFVNGEAANRRAIMRR